MKLAAATALGTKVNLPVTFGTPRDVYLDRFRGAVEDLAAKTRPQLVLVSAGFDSHRLDPVGSLGLETEDFGPLTQIVKNVAHEYAGGKLVSVLEGGYDPLILADCVQRHLEGLMND